jgi:hypothetical protein
MFRRISIRDDINERNRHIIALADRDGGRVRRTSGGDAMVGDTLTTDTVGAWDKAREAERAAADPALAEFLKADTARRKMLRGHLEAAANAIAPDEDEDGDEDIEDGPAHGPASGHNAITGAMTPAELAANARETAPNHRTGDRIGLSGRSRYLATQAAASRRHNATDVGAGHDVHQHAGGAGSGRTGWLSRSAADSRRHAPTAAVAEHQPQGGHGGGGAGLAGRGIYLSRGAVESRRHGSAS